MAHELLEYNSFDTVVNSSSDDGGGGWSLSFTGARSGSYLLHPSEAAPGPINGAFDEGGKIAVVKSKRGHVTEVRQQFSNVAGQVVRLYDATAAGGALGAAGAVEIQQGVGPLDPNRELVSLFTTDIDTAGPSLPHIVALRQVLVPY